MLPSLVCVCAYVRKTCDLFANSTRLLNGKNRGCVFIQSMLSVSKSADKNRKKTDREGAGVIKESSSETHTEEGYSNPSTSSFHQIQPCLLPSITYTRIKVALPLEQLPICFFFTFAGIHFTKLPFHTQQLSINEPQLPPPHPTSFPVNSPPPPHRPIRGEAVTGRVKRAGECVSKIYRRG